MCQLRSHVNIAADQTSSLQEELSALRNNLRREQQKNVELEDICRDLNQDNDRYLNMALRLESAIENLLVSLSLPTDSLYRTGATDYHELLCLIDNETPRLKTLMSGLNMLASLAVGLNSSIEMHKDQISTMQKHGRRLDGDKAGVEYCGKLSRRRCQSPSASSSTGNSETTTCAGDLDEFTATGISQTSVMAVEERLPLALPPPPNQPLPSTPRNSPSPKTQHDIEVKDRPLQPESRSPGFTGQLKCPPRELGFQSCSAFGIFDNLSGSNKLLRRDINCAISVNGHCLAGDPFCYHPGWRIHFGLDIQNDDAYISLKFAFSEGKFGKIGTNQKVKGFGMMWGLFREDSVVLKAVKPYKPASLRNLPLSLTELCADKHVRGTLWLVSLEGVFDSPPAHSRRVLENLDEDIKINLRALFKPQTVNQIDIWLINPKDGNRRKQRLDMDALMALQSEASLHFILAPTLPFVNTVPHTDQIYGCDRGDIEGNAYGQSSTLLPIPSVEPQFRTRAKESQHLWVEPLSQIKPSAPSSRNASHFRVARSSQPHSISTDLQQSIILRDELNNKRRKRRTKRKGMEGEHGSESPHIRDEEHNVEGGYRGLQEKSNKTIKDLVKKVNDMEDNWMMLQMRAGALSSEVDALRTAGAVQTTASCTCLKKGDANKQRGESQATDFGTSDWHAMDAGTSKDMETNMGRFSENAGGTESPRSKVAEAEPLTHQRAFEAEVTVQDVSRSQNAAPIPQLAKESEQAEVIQSQELVKKLQQRNTELEAIQARQNAEMTRLHLQNAAYHDLLEELVDNDRILEIHSENHSRLVLKAEDILQLAGASITEPFAPTHNGEVSHAPQPMHDQDDASKRYCSLAQTSNGEEQPMIAVPRRSNNGVSTGGHTVNTMITSRAAGLKARKRTLSELMEDTRESLMEHQRRRTGFASYVGVSNPAWNQGAVPTTAGNGFEPVHGDFGKGTELHAPSSVNLLSQQKGKIPSPVEDTATGSTFAVTKAPLVKSSSPGRASVSLPTSPATKAYQGPEVASNPSGDSKTPSRIFQFRSNTQGQSPWKVPVGPRKWQNSALRKGR